MCEEWGWFYDDGTDDGSYVMEIREEGWDGLQIHG
jgi:hypothetical protein